MKKQDNIYSLENRKAVIPAAIYRMFTGKPEQGDTVIKEMLTNTDVMITNVTARPNPFFTTITLDVACEQSRHTIVRMIDEDGRIIKMFSWYLVKGTNITTINELSAVTGGSYLIDIVDTEGNILFTTTLTKE